MLLLDTDTRPQKAETMGVLVDWPGEQPAPSAFIFWPANPTRPQCRGHAGRRAAGPQPRGAEHALRGHDARQAPPGAVVGAARQLGPGSWWNRLAPLVTEVDLQAQAPAAHGAEAAAPADAPETFTIPSLPALPEALQTARVHTAAGLEGDAPWPCRAMRNRPRCRARAMPCTSCWSRPAWLVPRWPMCVLPAGLPRLGPPGDADHDITPPPPSRPPAWRRPFWRARAPGRGCGTDPDRHQRSPAALTRARACASTGWCSAAPSRPMTPGGLVVLDYKNATQPQRQQALVAQLQRYREAVSVLMPGEVVHAAFLTAMGAW